MSSRSWTSRLFGGCRRCHCGLNPGDGLGDGFPYHRIEVLLPLLKRLERLLGGNSHRADCFCRDMTRELTGARPEDRDFREATKLGEQIAAGGFSPIAGIEPSEILMKYEQ